MSRSARSVVTLVTTVVLAIGIVLSARTGPARADQTGQADPPGSDTAGGYSVSVQVRFTGNAAPGGVRSVRVHPVCWWAPAGGAYQDAKAMLAWYDEVTAGIQSAGIRTQYGPRSIWADAAAREAAGEDLSWYKAFCYDPRDYDGFGLGGVEGGNPDPINGNPALYQVFPYRAFDAAAPVPAPEVTPAELARAARDAMVIPEPAIDRNPKVRGARNATLVGLPTFFWVTNPAAVGGEAGSRSIRAEVVGAADPVWAEVTARTGGLDLDWPGGHQLCAPGPAALPYAEGMADGAGCTVDFLHASTGFAAGYPVRASTAWTADWTGSGGTAGQLDPLARETVTDIPVAEVQNIVRP